MSARELKARLDEDRALRRAARALVADDVARVSAGLAERSISDRVVDRIGNGASRVLNEAVEVADSHRGVVAVIVASIAVWFARHPLGRMMFGHDKPGGTAPSSRD